MKNVLKKRSNNAKKQILRHYLNTWLAFLWQKENLLAMNIENDNEKVQITFFDALIAIITTKVN